MDLKHTQRHKSAIVCKIKYSNNYLCSSSSEVEVVQTKLKRLATHSKTYNLPTAVCLKIELIKN